VESIYLKRNREDRISQGYPWIFADDISSLPLLEASEAGTLFKVCDSRGKFISTAYSDSNIKLVARVISSQSIKELDVGFFISKLSEANEKRAGLKSEFYRLCNSEGDFLPGLIIDRFASIFSIKFTTDGLFRYRKEVIEAISQLFKVDGMVVRHGNEQFEIGSIPDEIVVKEDDISFLCDLKKGQKTGWYFDQRENHALVAKLAKDKSVLDVFSYNGGFGVKAAKFGAKKVCFIDSSERAIDYCKRNIELNNCQSKCEYMNEDALDGLFRIKEDYDIVVLDPPPFIKSKKDKVAGVKGYKKLVELAIPLVKNGGYLFFATCSHHMFMNDVLELLDQTSRELSYKTEVLSKMGAAADHPVHKLVPQTRYLNAVLVKISKS